jgi:hypothetical protein
MEEFNFWWSKRAHERWRATRKKGFGYCVLEVLGLEILCVLVKAVFPGKYRVPIDTNPGPLAASVIGMLVIAALGSIILWNVSERNFRRHEPDR